MAANVNQITTDLRMMGDKQLQQYAAMHKNDPFIFPLAFQESQARQHMRAAQQAQMGGQPQPKVVDQDLAQMAPPAPAPQQMLPEDQGIGQLPAQNLTKMAGGGIVAFDEGGEVPGYAAGVLVGSDGYWDPNTGEYVIGAPEDRRTFGEKFKSAIGYGKGMDIDPRGGIPVNANTPVKPAVDQTTAENARLAAQNQGAAGVPTGGLNTLIQPKSDLGGQGGAGAGKLPPAAPTGTPAVGGGFEQRFMDMVNKGEVSKEDRLKEITDIDKPVLEKMRGLIDEQKSKLKTDKEENFYMSLIQGGLAAAGASGPNALQNLAQGFEKGAAHYGEGLKDLRKAAQENTKMELAMSQYEATGKKDALKAYYDHQDKKQGYTATGLAQIIGHEISAAGSVAAAGAGANAQLNMLEKLGAASEGSNLRKGFELKTQEDKIPRLYAEYTKMLSDPMKGEDFFKKYPTFEVYKAGMGGAGGGQFINIPNGAAPSTSVLPRKG